MNKFAILGHPVKHSLSPKIYKEAFLATNLNYTYEAIDVLPIDLGSFLEKTKAEKSYLGFSVTVPHKEQIIKFLDNVTDVAKTIGAVNTVTLKEGKLYGDNTDWLGIIEALKPVSNIQNKTVLLLGAGGAARAALYTLNKLGVKQITIWNRTTEKAKILAREFKCNFSETINLNADVIINSTSVGLSEGDKLPVSDDQLAKTKFVFDMVYGKTDLLMRAEKQGCKTINGIEMLLGQAYKQFEIFTGVSAPKDAIRASII